MRFRSLNVGHIPGFTSDGILYERGRAAPACHCLQSLFMEKAAYARRRGAWSFVKSEPDLTAMQWESCCVPAYLLFFCFILLYCSLGVWGMHLLSSFVGLHRRLASSPLFIRDLFHRSHSVVLVGSSLNQKLLDSCTP